MLYPMLLKLSVQWAGSLMMLGLASRLRPLDTRQALAGISWKPDHRMHRCPRKLEEDQCPDDARQTSLILDEHCQALEPYKVMRRLAGLYGSFVYLT